MRYRWLNVDWLLGIDQLTSGLKDMPFREDGMYGFIIDRFRPSYIEGRYIEREEHSDRVVDPFGKEILFDTVQFNETEFVASVAPFGLRLRNPARTLTSFISSISQAADFRLVVEDVIVDVAKWADVYRSLSDNELVIDSIQIKNLILGDLVEARAVVSGKGNVGEALEALTRDRSYLVEKVRCRSIGGAKFSIVLSRTGVANIVGELSDAGVGALEKSLYASAGHSIVS